MEAHWMARAARLVFFEVEGTFALIGVYAITLTGADISASLVAFAALITALGTAIAAVMTARMNGKKLDAVNTKADIITGHVNSAATAAATKIEGLEKEIALLRTVMSDYKQTAALLAQSVADAKASIVTGDRRGLQQQQQPHLESSTDESVLKAIEVNTKDTADALKDKQ